MLPQFQNRSTGRKIPTLTDDHNVIQPGRGGVLAVHGELRQFLHKPFGDGAIQECEGFQGVQVQVTPVRDVRIWNLSGIERTVLHLYETLGYGLGVHH